MEYVGQYELLSGKNATSSAEYWKAKKDGNLYFLKKFNDPKRPTERASEAVRKLLNEQCNKFYRERKRVNNAIKEFAGSSLIAPVEIFEYDRSYYQATPWRDIKAKSIAEIAKLSEKEKRFLLKTAAQSLKLLNERGIIHLDVKPDNLPVTEPMAGKLSCSLIDFDSSYFEDAMPEPEVVAVTDPYMSPELAAYKMGKSAYGNKVTVKNDVFALAIVFHMYWTGRNFIYESSDSKDNDCYLYNAVFEEKEVKTSPEVPQWLSELLFWMIKKNPEERPTMAQVVNILQESGNGKVSRDSDSVINSENTVGGPEKDEKEPLQKERDIFAEIRKQREKESGKVKPKQYQKGKNFPENATSFTTLPNGNIKIVFKDGVKVTYSVAEALRNKYITN